MWRFTWNKPKEEAPLSEEELLEQELWKAHKDWEMAQARLDYALEKDEIDYAVFMLEATEKRYEIILKKLKASMPGQPGEMGREPMSGA